MTFSRFDGLRADERAEFLATWDTAEEIARAEQMARLCESEWFFDHEGRARIQHRELDGVYVTATEVVWGDA